MPYYVFRVRPFTPPEQLAEFGRFAEASAHAKALRGEASGAAGERIKVMFADSPLAAEDLLCQWRDGAPGPGDD
ncbi:MAG TPA: hypothetical protein VFQ16_06250 [Burkholderiaceae bacterium]|nr:hypothetical protein [Burkholderiaceae bacterium]